MKKIIIPIIMALVMTTPAFASKWISEGSIREFNILLRDEACNVPVTLTYDLSEYSWKIANWVIAKQDGMTCTITSSDQTSIILSCLRTAMCPYICPDDLPPDQICGGSTTAGDILITFDRTFGTSCKGKLQDTGDNPTSSRAITTLDGNYYYFNDGKIYKCVDGDYVIDEDCWSKGLAVSTDFPFGAIQDPNTGYNYKNKPTCVVGCSFGEGKYITNGGYMCRADNIIGRCDATTNIFTQELDCAAEPRTTICLENEQTWCLNKAQPNVLCSYETNYNGVHEHGQAMLNEQICIGNPEGTSAGIKKCVLGQTFETVYSCASNKCLSSTFCQAPVPKPPNPNPVVHFSWIIDKFNQFVGNLQYSLCVSFNIWC